MLASAGARRYRFLRVALGFVPNSASSASRPRRYAMLCTVALLTRTPVSLGCTHSVSTNLATRSGTSTLVVRNEINFDGTIPGFLVGFHGIATLD